MRVLLYSAVLYLLGIAIVLYVRPSLMFKHNGQWKEFGLKGTDTTYFPFWLFCILWAVVAHGVIRLVYSEGPIDPIKTAATVSSLTARIHDTTPAPPTPLMNEPEATEEARPGYYKLDKSLMKPSVYAHGCL